ncbi:MAG: hypothetical protein KJ592_00595 [Nanoarchaeota archaeon]|nr:hypothetical protein [Nanoarchaeota archaeon]
MKKLGCFMFVLVLLCSLGAAKLSISELSSVYNLGDVLDINAEGLVGAENGNLNVDLICGNRTVNLEKMSARRYGSGEEFSYSLSKTLDIRDLEIDDLTSIVGGCQVRLMIGGGAVSSKIFTISNSVGVDVSLNKASYNPGEEVVVGIDAVKANGNLLNGFAEGSDAGSFVVDVVDGFASKSFTIPKTMEAGIYSLNVRVYDVGAGSILNEGSSVASYSVNQIASSLVLSLSDENVMPGNDFTVGAEIYDQSGVGMSGTVSVKVVSPENGVLDLTVGAGEFKNINFVPNSSVGTWQIIGSFEDVEEVRTFEMLEVQRVEFDFEDSVLTVKNVGNVLYNRSISVQIGEENIALDLSIGVGEVRKFALDAPTGEYEILVGDGENSISRQVLLTGGAISVRDFKDVGFFKSYSIVWIFLIIVVGGIGIVLIIRFRKTRTVTADNRSGVMSRIVGKFKRKVPARIKTRMGESLYYTNKSPAVQGLDSDSYSHKDKTMYDMTTKNVGSAESTLVLKGEKYLSAVVSLSVKNFGALSDSAKGALQNVVGEVQAIKGLVDWKGDYVFVVFSPIVTKTYNNEALAVKAGMQILGGLNAYNKKFKDKIEFNLGVHVGELVASKAGEKLKYTSIGNTISLAKRISDSDSGKLIVSDPIRKKMIRDLKVARGNDIGENLTFVVLEVKDRSGDAARLQQLLKRQGG